MAFLRIGWALLLAAPVAMGSVGSSAAQTVSGDTSRVALPEAPQPQGLIQQPQKPSKPSLSDLGLSSDQTKPDPDLQRRLDCHTEMLEIHPSFLIGTVRNEIPEKVDMSWHEQ